MLIKEHLHKIKQSLSDKVILVAVTKTKSNADIMKAYDAGHRDFGENKIQEMVRKYEELPKDIRWHMIGHVQRNKVKYMAPFVHLIHAVDSLKLLKEINKQAKKHQRVINCLLQARIAQEETKFGMPFNEIDTLIKSTELPDLQNIKITGLMGMASFTDDKKQLRKEFKSLSDFFKNLVKSQNKTESKIGDAPSSLQHNLKLTILSMGMSADYLTAVEEGSTMVRVGSAIFGLRNYI